MTVTTHQLLAMPKWRGVVLPSLCNLYKRKIIKHFNNKGYPKHILKILASMKHCDRKRMLLPKLKKAPIKRGIPLCLEYMECQPTLKYILKKRWKITYNDFRLITVFPNAPTLIHTNRKKIGAILSKKYCNFHIHPSNPKLSPHEAKRH